MRRRGDRYPVELAVELYVDHWHETVRVQDVSQSGMFLQTSTAVPVGASVRIAIAPEGRPLVTVGRVTHTLRDPEAREVGRVPGLGIALREPEGLGDELFAIAIGRLIRSSRAATPPAMGLHVVVADPQTRLLERMSDAFGAAGFFVATATNGMDTLAACLRQIPDVVLLDCALPIVSGFGVLEALGRDQRLAGVPVLMMSGSANDRSIAAEHGVEFLAKPFATHDAIERARRIAVGQYTTERVVLSGSLEHVGLSALLTMLDQERKTGRLVLTGERTAWIELVDGRIVDAGPATGERSSALVVVLTALDWSSGTFALSTGGRSESLTSIGVLEALLEHARLRDEAARRSKRLFA